MFFSFLRTLFVCVFWGSSLKGLLKVRAGGSFLGIATPSWLAIWKAVWLAGCRKTRWGSSNTKRCCLDRSLEGLRLRDKEEEEEQGGWEGTSSKGNSWSFLIHRKVGFKLSKESGPNPEVGSSLVLCFSREVDPRSFSGPKQGLESL